MRGLEQVAQMFNAAYMGISATGGCFVSFHLAKAETTQKSIEKLISKVLYKAKEILTRKKGNHTGNEIHVLASVFVHKGSVRYL